MATAAILPSHACLRDRFGPRSCNPNPNPRMNQSSRCRRRKRSPSDGIRRSNHRENLSSSPPAKGLVMGQVKILKRGEELKPTMFFSDGGGDLELCSTDPLGPDPDVVQKEIRVPDLYAGSTSNVSAPPPSQLPFPTSLVRTRVMETDLRKLLKI